MWENGYGEIGRNGRMGRFADCPEGATDINIGQRPMIKEPLLLYPSLSSQTSQTSRLAIQNERLGHRETG